MRTPSAGVARYLELVREHGPDLAWHVVAGDTGTVNKIALGPEVEIIPGLYLYTDDEFSAPASL